MLSRPLHDSVGLVKLNAPPPLDCWSLLNVASSSTSLKLSETDTDGYGAVPLLTSVTV